MHKKQDQTIHFKRLPCFETGQSVTGMIVGVVDLSGRSVQPKIKKLIQACLFDLINLKHRGLNYNFLQLIINHNACFNRSAIFEVFQLKTAPLNGTFLELDLTIQDQFALDYFIITNPLFYNQIYCSIWTIYCKKIILKFTVHTD